MAELPRVMAERFVKDYALPEYDATLLTQSKDAAAYFEATTKACGQPKLASNWIINDIFRLSRTTRDADGLPSAQEVREVDSTSDSYRVNSAQLAEIISNVQQNVISNASGKKILDALWKGDGKETVDAAINRLGLKQMNDTGALEAIIDEVLAANPKNVEEFKAGNAKALNGLVGPIMKASKGKANPAQVNELLMKKLS
jgi:aspartyl-tRNA(Asn)/glutamyl-tRNA(Gln) amidotransferase subunit B